MKRTIQVILILSTLLLFTSCNNKKETLIPVSIGNLSFEYDSQVWDHKENIDNNAPLEFVDENGNLIQLHISHESTYQHPLDLIKLYNTIISSYRDYEVFLEPTEIKVNGITWYEFGFTFNEGTTTRKVYQRYYGKYYNAASVSYISTKDNYETGFQGAINLMEQMVIDELTNEVNEGKAYDFLLGEWELVNSGYLILHDNGTYEWFKDNSKDKSNMHFGTFGCDVENQIMSLNEGDGIYLVLFPESLIIDGETKDTTVYKIDYLISFDKKDTDTEGYQMVNMSSYTLYTMIKQ